MKPSDTIVRLTVGMAKAVRVIPLGCCGTYAKAVRELEKVERWPRVRRMFHIEEFV